MVEPEWIDEGYDELSPSEYPDADELYDGDSAVVVPCPECGADIDEEAPQCSLCGHYVTHETSFWSGRPAWWILLGVLGIVAMILVLVLG